jgi:ABC-type polysaccharide/polyol phosphate transport system ATPase subunit
VDYATLVGDRPRAILPATDTTGEALQFYQLSPLRRNNELAEFMNEPVRTFSSGMLLRLGFSVAVNLDPEILLIDEVLAVGDEAFQAKCMRKMESFRSSGTTMVFVSHNLAAVESICDRVALLEGGRLVTVGPPKEAVGEYLHRVRTAPQG